MLKSQCQAAIGQKGRACKKALIILPKINIFYELITIQVLEYFAVSWVRTYPSVHAMTKMMELQYILCSKYRFLRFSSYHIGVLSRVSFFYIINSWFYEVSS